MDFDVGAGTDGVTFGDCYGSGLSSVSYGGGFDVLDQNYGSSAGISYDVNQPVYNHQENSIKTENEQVSYGGDNGYNIKYEEYQTTNQQSNNLTYKTEPFDIKKEVITVEEVPPVAKIQRIEDSADFIKSRPIVSISNVVSNFRCRCHLNLRQIAIKSKNVVYKRDQGKVMMKLRDPNMMANIWSSGKVVCQGAKSEDDALRGSRKFARIIQKIGFPNIRVSNYKVVNVLGNCRVPFAIDIMQFSSHNAGPQCSYEPELHPAVTFKPKNGTTLKIFSTGALTILGRNVGLVEEALNIIYPLVYPFRKRGMNNGVKEEEDVSDKEEF